MKNKLLIFIICLLAFPTIAQTKRGVVYLKNGSQIKGKYQYTNDKSQIKLYSNRNIFVIDTVDIADISTRRKRYGNTVLQKTFKPLKYYFNAEIGVLFGNEDNSQSAPLSFLPSINYNVNNKLSVGVGIGIEFLKESCFPVFLNLQYNLRNWQSTPFVFVKAGYNFPAEETTSISQQYMQDYIWPQPVQYYNKLEAKGGVLFNSGIGYKRMYSPNFGLSLAFGYRFQRLGYKDNGESENAKKDYRLNLDYNRLSVHLGFIF